MTAQNVVRSATNIVVSKQANCETFIGTSRLTKILIDRTSGIRGASLSWVTMPPGGETEKHAKEETEIIFVIQGSLRLNTPDGSVVIESGDGGAIPPKTLHSHENCGHGWNQFLVIITPDGPEQGFRGRSILEREKVQS
jgi:quercetin dioxygenase-like cupin family protein